MPTTPPTIPASPQKPQRNVKATFSDLLDAFITWLVAAPGVFGALALNVFNNATEAFQSATAALNWAGIASTKATEAAASASNAYESVVASAAAVNAVPWTSGTTYQQYQRAFSKVNFKVYIKTTTAAVSSGGGTDPANDPANWQATGVALMPNGKRTSNTMLRLSDLGSFVEITSGTFTQTFDTLTTLGNGWYCYIRNGGTGNITIPSSDGRANWIMYPGEVRLFTCDSAALRSHVVVPCAKIFAASDTWVKPPGYTAFDVMEWGAGASGAVARAASSGHNVFAGAGGAGAFAFGRFLSSLIPDSVLVTVGAGGTAVSASSDGATASGIAGGSSSFGSYMTAAGGVGGASGADGTGGAAGSPDAGSAFTPQTEAGSNGGSCSMSSASNSENRKFAGTGGGASAARVGMYFTSAPGTTVHGGRGGNANTSDTVSNATAGAIPGGGGGACATREGVTSNSAAGGRGEVRVVGVV